MKDLRIDLGNGVFFFLAVAILIGTGIEIKCENKIHV